MAPQIRLTVGGREREREPKTFSITNKPPRPKTIRQEEIYHEVPATATTKIYEFFTKPPVDSPIDGNFNVPYIKKEMEILGIAVDIIPTIFWNVSNTLAEHLNRFTRGVLQLFIGESIAFTSKVESVGPSFEIEEISGVSGAVNIVAKPAKPHLFQEFDKGIIDKFVVEDKDEIKVRMTFPEDGFGMTPPDLWIRCRLIVKPVKRPYVG